MTNFVLTLGFLAQPPVEKQDGIASVALAVDPVSANANDLDTQVNDTVEWKLGGVGPDWSTGTRIKAITIGQKTGTLLLTQSAFAPAMGSDEHFRPVETGDQVPPGVSNVYKLEKADRQDSESLKLSVINALPAAGQAYTYRVVLHSPRIGGTGVWWIDPEIDICPP